MKITKKTCENCGKVRIFDKENINYKYDIYFKTKLSTQSNIILSFICCQMCAACFGMIEPCRGNIRNVTQKVLVVLHPYRYSKQY